MGWAGHTRDGGIISNVTNIQERIKTRNQEALSAVKVWTKAGSWVSLPLPRRISRSSYPDNSIKVDIRDGRHGGLDLLQEGILQLFFRFHQLPRFSVELNLEDRERSLDRDWPNH